jgi:hypothetical protein
MKRRDFIKTVAAAAPMIGRLRTVDARGTVSWEEFLMQSAVSREVIDRFLRGPSWARFDPELGYTIGNYLPHDGIDGGSTLSTVQANGARTSFLYSDKKCRINTYGDSFTQCHQVSDGETWQEYLAAHLGEPLRNFGVGGFGVYQAYRRMLREERSNHGAEYVTLYIWGDDHIRSLLRCRRALYPRFDLQGGRMFHANFWAHVEMDLEHGEMVEKENLLSTPKALYRMTDPQFIIEHLRDDLALRLYAFKLGEIRDLDREQTSKLAAHLKYPLDWSRESVLDQQVGELLDRYSLRATLYILAKTREFTSQGGKKLLVILFDPYRAMTDMQKGGARYDQEIVDYLRKEKFLYFDMNEVHLRDFKNYNLPFEEYRSLYLRGHYNPRGNHFFAYSIKDTLVNWLDPKPITYRNPDVESIDFKGYLAGYH